MSYTALFLLFAIGYVFGAPVLQESLQYHFIKCVSGENDTFSKHIIELTNINETCVQVNKSLPTGDETFLYIVPESETTMQIEITTESCSTSLPNIYLSLCNDHIDHNNNTEIMVTFLYKNISSTEIESENENFTTNESNINTDDSIYTTSYYNNNDSDENGIKINEIPSYNSDEVTQPVDTDSDEDNHLKVIY